MPQAPCPEGEPSEFDDGPQRADLVGDASGYLAELTETAGAEPLPGTLRQASVSSVCRAQARSKP